MTDLYIRSLPRAPGEAVVLAQARQALSRAEAARAEDRLDEALKEYAATVRLAGDLPAAGPIRADASRGAGIVRMAQADCAGAEREFQGSLEMARECGDDRRVGLAANALAAVAFERGQYRRAQSLYETALAAAGMVDDELLAAQVEQNLGALHAARGERALAEESFRRAIERFEKLGGHPCAGKAWNNLGLVLTAQCRLDEARDAYDRALAESGRRGDSALALKVTINMGRLEVRSGRPYEAQRLASLAWDQARTMEKGTVTAGALCLMSEALRALGDRVGATSHYRRALEHVAEGRAPLVEAEIWVQIGHLHLEQGDTERARSTWQFARHLYRMLGAEPEVQRLLDLIDSTVSTQMLEAPDAQIGAA